MRELSLHILDVVQNSLAADASLVEIRIDESPLRNLLTVEITDNGKGIAPEKLPEVTDPFYTTRSSRKVGLGLALFQAAAQRSGGKFLVKSEPGLGTTVVATFKYDDIDRAPLGNIADTILSMVIGNSGVDFCYHHRYESKDFTFNTQELSRQVSRRELEMPVLAIKLREYLRNAVNELYAT